MRFEKFTRLTQRPDPAKYKLRSFNGRYFPTKQTFSIIHSAVDNTLSICQNLNQGFYWVKLKIEKADSLFPQFIISLTHF